MDPQSATARFPTVGDGSGFADSDRVFTEELQLALRNKGMPLEGLRYPVTPTGMQGASYAPVGATLAIVLWNGSRYLFTRLERLF